MYHYILISGMPRNSWNKKLLFWCEVGFFYGDHPSKVIDFQTSQHTHQSYRFHLTFWGRFLNKFDKTSVLILSLVIHTIDSIKIYDINCLIARIFLTCGYYPLDKLLLTKNFITLLIKIKYKSEVSWQHKHFFSFFEFDIWIAMWLCR